MDIPPGLRQIKGETVAAWRAFCVYVDMEDRHLPTVSTMRGHGPNSKSMVRVWARKYRWRERATRYDANRLHEARSTDMARRVRLQTKMDAERYAVHKIAVDSMRDAVKTCRDVLKHQDTPPAVKLQAADRLIKLVGPSLEWFDVAPQEAQAGLDDAVRQLLLRARQVLTGEEVATFGLLLGKIDDAEGDQEGEGWP